MISRRTLCTVMIAVGICLRAAAPSAATDSVAMDGTWWQQLPEQAKVFVVEGMIDSYETGWLQGSGQVWLRVSKVQSSKSVMQSLSASDFNKLLEATSPSLITFSKTFGTYVDEINDFYANYPAKMQLRVGAIVGCLRDNPEITCDALGSE